MHLSSKYTNIRSSIQTHSSWHNSFISYLQKPLRGTATRGKAHGPGLRKHTCSCKDFDFQAEYYKARNTTSSRVLLVIIRLPFLSSVLISPTPPQVSYKLLFREGKARFGGRRHGTGGTRFCKSDTWYLSRWSHRMVKSKWQQMDLS